MTERLSDGAFSQNGFQHKINDNTQHKFSDSNLLEGYFAQLLNDQSQLCRHIYKRRHLIPVYLIGNSFKAGIRSLNYLKK